MSVDLRHGRWQDVLADVRCDAVIVDAPYSERTHRNAAQGQVPDGIDRREINYAWWGKAEIDEFVESWAPRTSCWIASLTDSELSPLWIDAFRRAGLYDFPRLGVVISGMGVRLAGDGPASWTLDLCVARRRAKRLTTVRGATSIWRALPGGYTGSMMGGSGGGRASGGGGRNKPPWLCEALVRDYSDPGMVVCDPCAGHGGILRAAEKLGRIAIGAEMDAEAHALATGRALPKSTAEQPSLFGEVA